MAVRSRWVLVVLLAAGAERARAQEYPLAPLIARLPGSTRALAMANADMGGRESDVIFYNPAQLAVAHGSDASAELYTHGDLLATLSTETGLAGGALGVGVQSLTFSSASDTYASPTELGTRGPLASSGLILAAGYAHSLFGFRAGANVKVLQQQIGSASDTRAALDAGLSYDLWRGTAGLSVQNVGPDLRTFNGHVSQPTQANLGFSSGRYEAGPLDLSAAATGSVLRGRDVRGGGRRRGLVQLAGRLRRRGAGRRAAGRRGRGPMDGGGGDLGRSVRTRLRVRVAGRAAGRSPHRNPHPVSTRFSMGAVVALLVAGLGGCTQSLKLSADDSGTVLARQLITAPNPGEPGPYRVRYLTYGSGTDKRRAAYPRLGHDQDARRGRVAVRVDVAAAGQGPEGALGVRHQARAAQRPRLVPRRPGPISPGRDRARQPRSDRLFRPRVRVPRGSCWRRVDSFWCRSTRTSSTAACAARTTAARGSC